MDGRAPPVIDFSGMKPISISPYSALPTSVANLNPTSTAFYKNSEDDPAAKQQLVDQVRSACLAKGFFQLTNHGVSADLQDAVFEQARGFFALPLEEKMEISLSKFPFPFFSFFGTIIAAYHQIYTRL